MQKEKSEKSYNKYLALIMLMMAQISTCGDNTVINLITSALVDDLHATMNQVQMVNLVFPLVTGALMIFGGMIGLAIGWRKSYFWGSILLAVGEFLAVIAPNVMFLCWVSRVVCGLGASLLVPAVLGLCVVLFKGKDRALAFGSMGTATGLAAILVPPLAGAIIGSYGWRWAFIALTVYFAAQAIFSKVFIPETKGDAKIRLDYKGAALMAVGMVVMIYGITKISVWGLIAPLNAPFEFFGMSPALPLVAAGFLLLFVLFFYEQKTEKKYGSCLIPSSYLYTQQVRNGLFLTSFLYICFGTVGFLVVTWLQLVAGYSPMMTGLLLVAMAVPMIVASMAIPKLLPNISPYSVCCSGIVITAVGCLCMWLGVVIDGINDSMAVGLFALGLGQGFIASQSSMIIAQAINERDAAQSGGIQASARNVGQAFGIAAIGVILLFSLTGEFKTNVERLPISQELKQEANQIKTYQLLSDKNFEEILQARGIDKKEANLIMGAYREARLGAVKYAFMGLLIIVVLHLFGLGGVPKKSFY